MNFGYLIIISDDGKNDYFRMAKALSYSIKVTQKNGMNKVALVTDNLSKIKSKSEPLSMFDHIIEWNQETFWNGRSWMDQLTPFDYTVCLDADMLFMADYSSWVEYFIENSDLYVANKAYTFKNEIVQEDYYRKAFRDNDLPDLYSFYTFFKKSSSISKEFFELGRSIIKNPNEFSNLYLKKRKPKILGTDEAFGLAAKILGIEDQISYPLEFPRVAHLKPMVQNWGLKVEKISDAVGFYLDENARLKVGNYQLNNIVHYVEKDFITEDILKIYKNLYYGTNS
jgi:hypothetical protein